MDVEEIECPRCVGTGVRKVIRKFRHGSHKQHRVRIIECQACRGTGYVTIVISTETPPE